MSRLTPPNHPDRIALIDGWPSFKRERRSRLARRIIKPMAYAVAAFAWGFAMCVFFAMGAPV